MNIPDAAIHTVAEHMATMDSTDEVGPYRTAARLALEAALPHLGETQWAVEFRGGSGDDVVASSTWGFADEAEARAALASPLPGTTPHLLARIVGEWTEVKP